MPLFHIDVDLQSKSDFSPEEIKEVGYFSDNAGTVTLTQQNLNKYKLPNTISSNQCPYGINTLLGYKSYKPKTFKSKESTIGNFLSSIVLNESEKKFNINVSKINLFAPSSFFQYISTLKNSEFYIIYIKNKIIIANTDTRLGQNTKMSYAGIRFEDLLNFGDTNHKTLNNLNLYEKILSLKISGLSCLYFAEIDTSTNENLTSEIKMILCKNNIPSYKMTDKQRILKMLNLGNNYFHSFILRLLIQCKFAKNEIALIGIRDASFNIRNINEYSISHDLIPYCKGSLPNEYSQYISSKANITNVLNQIKKVISVENPVYKLKIGHDGYKLTSVDDLNQRADMIETVMISEFMDLLINL